jgi:hypothetical protein
LLWVSLHQCSTLIHLPPKQYTFSRWKGWLIIHFYFPRYLMLSQVYGMTQLFYCLIRIRLPKQLSHCGRQLLDVIYDLVNGWAINFTWGLIKLVRARSAWQKKKHFTHPYMVTKYFSWLTIIYSSHHLKAQFINNYLQYILNFGTVMN